MREVLHTLLSLNRSGCQWDMLPHDVLPKSPVYDDFVPWRDDGTWAKLVEVWRERMRAYADEAAYVHVIVNERRSVDNGEMVIAMTNGSSATVKKFFREKDGRIRLQPANETMDPIYVSENDITIEGVVVGVLRRF